MVSIFNEDDIDDYDYLGIDLSQFDKEPPDIFRSLIDEHDDPRKTLVRIIKNPDNLYWTVKHLLGFDLFPYQLAVLQELFYRSYPMLLASRGGSKTTILAIYALLRCLLSPGAKVVIVASAFRQSKIMFETIENIWHKSPILRDIYAKDRRSGPRKDPDKYALYMDDSFIIAIPVGTGDKIRGLRATHLICDEFSVQIPEIFETVIAGFASVSSSPVENAKHHARMKRLIAENDDLNNMVITNVTKNQTVLAGTASYIWNHMYTYFKKYHDIIESKGDRNKLGLVFPDGIPENFDWRDYSVIRIPIDKLPTGMMDQGAIARSKATMHTGTFSAEYGTIWINDSAGFFKRSLIESCVVKEDLWIGNEVIKPFDALVRGYRGYRYIMGVDGASEIDNAAIVILEIRENHRRVVYSWTTNRKLVQEQIQRKIIEDSDYYGYIGKKIRELMDNFPIELISMDKQGGGIAIMESLHDKDKMRPGDLPIYPINTNHILSDGKELPTDDLPGLHIIEFVQFARADWVMEANHGMRKDMEDKILLFPYFDVVTLAVLPEGNPIYDSLEECWLETEQLKDELVTIIHTRTDSGRDRWDTPEIRLQENKKGHLRKDRYSALLMANASSRKLHRNPGVPAYQALGGFAGQISTKYRGQLYVAPDWFSSACDFGAGVRKD